MKTDPSASSRARTVLAFLLVFSAGMLMAFHPMILTGFELIQWDLNDTRFISYVFEHGYQWFMGNPKHADFWSPAFFHPVQNVAAYSEIFLGTGPLYWIGRWIGLSPLSAFQLWMLCVGALNFIVCYAFLRRCVEYRVLPCLAGAFLFSFGAPRIAQLGHQQLLPHFFSLIALWSLIRIWQRRGNPYSWSLLFAVSVVLQLYAGFYLGWFLDSGFPSPSSTCFWSALAARLISVLRSSWMPLALGALVSAVLLWPMLKGYLMASKQVGFRHFVEIQPMLPRPQSWIYHSPWHWIYGWQIDVAGFGRIPMGHEHHLGIGFVTTVLVILGLRALKQDRSWGPWGKTLWVTTWSLIVLATCLFHWSGATLWYIPYYLFPGANAIRALSRIGILLLIPASIALASFFQKRRDWRWALGLLLVTMIEQGQTTPSDLKAEADLGPELIRRELREECKFFFFSPLVRRGQYIHHDRVQIDAMWAQLLSGKPTINGYSGHSPPGWYLHFAGMVSPEDEVRVRHHYFEWLERNGLRPQEACWVRLTPEQYTDQLEKLRQ